MRWLCILALILAPSFSVTAASARVRMNLNNDWQFKNGEAVGNPASKDFDDARWETVTVPHSHRQFSADVKEFPEHGRELGWYRKHLNVPEEWLRKKVFLEFQGAMQTTKLWVNGTTAGEYAVSGFDSFHFDLSPFLRKGDNVIALLVDNRPNPKIPPDGVPMDFLLFGGLYRDVFLHVTDPVHITFPWEERNAGIRITYPEISTEKAVIQIETAVQNSSTANRECLLRTTIKGTDGNTVEIDPETQLIEAGKTIVFTQKTSVDRPHLWSPDDPHLYVVNSEIFLGNAKCDDIQTKTGMRWVRFDKKDGFFLNGQPLKLIGVNRHQSWPFIGFAVPNNLHRFDAKQIKEMGANWVRLCHYPHDPDFLDALDELGLMALAEAPTWNTVGPEHVWLANVADSFRRIIRRDRNHPSIIVWNACINHHGAHPALVKVATEEDPLRDRGQDTVPTPMDFKHGKVSGRGALSIEHTGHTLPAMRGAVRTTNGAGRIVRSDFDLARRHWEHIGAVLAKKDNSGSAAWAMYDYNTRYHMDEPGISWHGFSDIFRLPKLSYHWHQSEFSPSKSLYICPPENDFVFILSNAESVNVWADDGTGFKSISSPSALEVDHASLRHSPVRFNGIENARSIRVKGVWPGGFTREETWIRPGPAAKIQLALDSKSLEPGEITRVIATITDSQGNGADDPNGQLQFSVRGPGDLIGDNPAKVRAGKAVILYRAGNKSSNVSISAAEPKLPTQTISLKIITNAIN